MCAVLRRFAEPSLSVLGVAEGELLADASPRCMNFMVIRRLDMPVGVAVGAMVGSGASRSIVGAIFAECIAGRLSVISITALFPGLGDI